MRSTLDMKLGGIQAMTNNFSEILNSHSTQISPETDEILQRQFDKFYQRIHTIYRKIGQQSNVFGGVTEFRDYLNALESLHIDLANDLNQGSISPRKLREYSHKTRSLSSLVPVARRVTLH